MKKVLESKLSGKCPACDEQVDFDYIGEQDHPRGYTVSLYHCPSCGSTREEQSIRDYNSVKNKTS